MAPSSPTPIPTPTTGFFFQIGDMPKAWPGFAGQMEREARKKITKRTW